MKQLLKRKYILLTIVTMLLIFHTDFWVQASPSETGRLTIHADQQKGSFHISVYKIADHVDDSYECVPEFTGFNESIVCEDGRLKINDMTNASEILDYAEKLCDYVEDEDITPMFEEEVVNDKDFGEIPTGLYLIKQIEKESDLMQVNPVIIEVPYWEVEYQQDGIKSYEQVYNVNINLKTEEIDQVKPQYPDITNDDDEIIKQHSIIKTGDYSLKHIVFYSILFIISMIGAFETGKKIHRNRRKG